MLFPLRKVTAFSFLSFSFSFSPTIFPQSGLDCPLFTIRFSSICWTYVRSSLPSISASDVENRRLFRGSHCVLLRRIVSGVRFKVPIDELIRRYTILIQTIILDIWIFLYVSHLFILLRLERRKFNRFNRFTSKKKFVTSWIKLVVTWRKCKLSDVFLSFATSTRGARSFREENRQRRSMSRTNVLRDRANL